MQIFALPKQQSAEQLQNGTGQSTRIAVVQKNTLRLIASHQLKMATVCC